MLDCGSYFRYLAGVIDDRMGIGTREFAFTLKLRKALA